MIGGLSRLHCELNSYSIVIYRFSLFAFCFSLVFAFFFLFFFFVFMIRFNQLIFHAFPKLLSLNFMRDGHAMSKSKRQQRRVKRGE